MSTRSAYRTKQKDLLLSYFERVSGVHVTAADICDHFKKQGISIGQSTIYRHLEKLVDEGVINKYIIDGNSPACFEYTGPDSHVHSEVCYHCKCEKCGKLIHLHCDELQDHMYRDHHFRMDPLRTVFYGLCEDCM